MKNDIEKAIDLLKDLSISIAVVKNDKQYTSDKKGISPLLDLLQKNLVFFAGASVADKVIGSAAAFLMIKGNATAAYGEIISSKAKKLFERYSIDYNYGKQVDFIKNKNNDGLCPLEKLCLNIENPEEAYKLISAFLQSK